MKRNIILTKVFNAPVGAVWDAWKNPGIIKKWWGPDNFQCLYVDVDFRENGRTLVSMTSPKLGFPEQFSVWRFKKIIPLLRIEYIHYLTDSEGKIIDPISLGMPNDFPKEIYHIITFKTLRNGKTEVVITEKNWPVGSMMEMSRIGMEQCLEKMAKALRASKRSSKYNRQIHKDHRVDEYLGSFPSHVRELLSKLRETIAESAPEANETMSYGIPTFDLNGKHVVHFAAFKNHIGFFPTSSPLIFFKKDLQGFNTSKGTIQFPLDKPLPLTLVKKIVFFRVNQVLQR